MNKALYLAFAASSVYAAFDANMVNNCFGCAFNSKYYCHGVGKTNDGRCGCKCGLNYSKSQLK